MLVHGVKTGQQLLELLGSSATMVERPMAESIEYRPPTQSQNGNILAVSIPNSDTR